MTSGGKVAPYYAVLIGSHPDCDMVVDEPTVSSRHARLLWDGESQAWTLEDLGSTNGTFLGATRLQAGERVPVRLGDVVYLGASYHFALTAEHVASARPMRSLSGPATIVLVPPTASAATGPAQDPKPTAAKEAPGAAEARERLPSRRTDPLPDESRTMVLQPHLAELAKHDIGNPGRDTLQASSAPGPSRRGVDARRLTQELDSAIDDSPADGTQGDDDSPDPKLDASTLIEKLTRQARENQGAAGGRGRDPNDPSDGRSITIGYADDNTVQVKNPAVSGRHARLYKVGDRYLLEDQGSTNGTWVDGKQVQRASLTVDSHFSLGNYQLAVADLLPYFESAAARGPRKLARVKDPIVIGRAADADLTLDAPMISGRHARLTPLGGGAFLLEDLNSTNGTFLNSRENRVESATVGRDDIIFLGSYRLPLSRIASLLALDGEAQEVAIPPGKQVMVIGRDAECDIRLAAPQVSRRHAELERMPDGTWVLRDLGGVNGTYVNGRRVKSATVTEADTISFANYRIQLDFSAGVVRRDYHGDIMVQAERVSVRVKDARAPGGFKTIVDDVSFTAYPTEFVGLMGPSGAGKTTLMLALNGYTQPSAGRSLLKGTDLYANYDSFRGNVGYVPQDDIIYPELTVFESLYYTAKLRLPPDTSDTEIHAKIDDILEKLEIQQTRDVIVGDAVKKGISGGQRKRVNLAQELLTEPALLFLDEPTSGLASEDTINVMNLLRRMADEGRTILLTIHQPSLEAYRKLDNVIYLFQGKLVYYGPTYPDSILYFHPEVKPGTPEGDLVLSDPGNVLKSLAEDQRAALDETRPWEALDRVVEERRQEFQQSRHYQDYVYDRAVSPPDQVRLARGTKQRTRRAGMLRQWGILTRRYLTIKRKDTVNTAILLMQAPIIGLILWLVFGGRSHSYFERLNSNPSALFLLVASAIWFGCSNSAREIVGEQAIYKRERMVNLMIPSYVGSKFAVLGLVCAIQCGMLLGIVYPALGFEGNVLALYGILLLSSLAGVGMGLTLSAVVRSGEASIALVPLLLIPQIVLGGIIMPIHELNAPMQVLSSAMISRWGSEAALRIEYLDDDLARVRQECGIDVCPDPHAWDPNPPDPETTRTLISAFGEIADRNYFPSGEGASFDICTILCANAVRGEEVTPLERTFGLDLRDGETMRAAYRRSYDVGIQGVSTSVGVAVAVLILFNLLLFALVCSILRVKDGDVG
jgi:pSer/pThr/pTyr-binding forkhead associated (FHA) protein/ABC-type multidrug transport system ATPase subunit